MMTSLPSETSDRPMWYLRRDVYYLIPSLPTPIRITNYLFHWWSFMSDDFFCEEQWKHSVRWNHPSIECVLRPTWFVIQPYTTDPEKVPFTTTMNKGSHPVLIQSVWNEWQSWKDHPPWMSPDLFVQQSSHRAWYPLSAWIESFVFMILSESKWETSNVSQWCRQHFEWTPSLQQFLETSTETDMTMNIDRWKDEAQQQQLLFQQKVFSKYQQTVSILDTISSLSTPPMWTLFQFQGKEKVQKLSFPDSRSLDTLCFQLQWTASKTYPYVVVSHPSKDWLFLHPRATTCLKHYRKEWESKLLESSSMWILEIPFSTWIQDLTSPFFLLPSVAHPHLVEPQPSYYHVAEMEYQQAQYFSPRFRWIQLSKEHPEVTSITLETSENKIEDSLFQFLHLESSLQNLDWVSQLQWTDLGQKGSATLRISSSFWKSSFSSPILQFWPFCWKTAVLQSSLSPSCFVLWDMMSSVSKDMVTTGKSKDIFFRLSSSLRSLWNLPDEMTDKPSPDWILQLPTTWGPDQEYQLIFLHPFSESQRQCCFVWIEIVCYELRNSFSSWLSQWLEWYPSSFFSSFLPSSSLTTTTDTHAPTQKETDQIKKRKDLSMLFPDIFPKNFYKTHCQGEGMQPRLLDSTQVTSLPSNQVLQFPNQTYGNMEPQYYGCPPGSKYKYPGLKEHHKSDLMFRYVPCCYLRPQEKQNQEKMKSLLTSQPKTETEMKEKEGKYKENIITLTHRIQYRGQLGKLPFELSSTLQWFDPTCMYFRIGCPFPKSPLLMVFEYASLLRSSPSLSDALIHLPLSQFRSETDMFPKMKQVVNEQDRVWNVFFPFFTSCQIEELWKRYFQQEIEMPLMCILYVLALVYQVQPFVFYRDVRKDSPLHWLSFSSFSHRPQWSLLHQSLQHFPPLLLYAHHGGRMDILADTQHLPHLEIIIRQPLFQKEKYIDIDPSFVNFFGNPWSFYTNHSLTPSPSQLLVSSSSPSTTFLFHQSLISVEIDQMGHLLTLQCQLSSSSSSFPSIVAHACVPTGILGSTLGLDSVTTLPVSKTLPSLPFVFLSHPFFQWFQQWKQVTLYHHFLFLTLFDPRVGFDVTFCFSPLPSDMVQHVSTIFYSQQEKKQRPYHQRFRVVSTSPCLDFSWQRWISESNDGETWETWKTNHLVAQTWYRITSFWFSRYLHLFSTFSSMYTWKEVSRIQALRVLDQFEQQYLSFSKKWTLEEETMIQQQFSKQWSPQWTWNQLHSLPLWTSSQQLRMPSFSFWQQCRSMIESTRRHDPISLWSLYDSSKPLSTQQFECPLSLCPLWLPSSSLGTTSMMDSQSLLWKQQSLFEQYSLYWDTSHLWSCSLRSSSSFPLALGFLSYRSSSTITSFGWNHPRENPFFPYISRVYVLEQESHILPFFLYFQKFQFISSSPRQYFSFFSSFSSSPHQPMEMETQPQIWEFTPFQQSLSYEERKRIPWYSPVEQGTTHVFVYLCPF